MSRLGIFRKWKLSQKTLTPYSASCGGLWINFLFLSRFCHLLVYNIPGKVPKGAAWDISNRLRKGEVPPGLHHCCWFMADRLLLSPVTAVCKLSQPGLYFHSSPSLTSRSTFLLCCELERENRVDMILFWSDACPFLLISLFFLHVEGDPSR